MIVTVLKLIDCTTCHSESNKIRIRINQLPVVKLKRLAVGLLQDGTLVWLAYCMKSLFTSTTTTCHCPPPDLYDDRYGPLFCQYHSSNISSSSSSSNSNQ